MRQLHKILIGAAGALAVVAGSAALAAPADGPGSGPGMAQHGPWRGQADVAASAEKHLARLKAELKLTAQQEPAWQAFSTKAVEQAKAAQAQHQQLRQARDKDDAANLPAPERMARHIEQMRQHLASLEGMQVAVKDLYATLTPEQRAVADRHFERMHRGGMGHRMHRG